MLLNAEEVLASSVKTRSRARRALRPSANYSSSRPLLVSIATNLPNLFLTCIGLLELYNLEARKTEATGLETESNNSAGTFSLLWGRACGLDDPDNYDERLAYHGIRPNLEGMPQYIME